MAGSILESTGGKVGIAVVAVLAVGAAVFMGIRSSSDGSQPADQKEVQSDIQKQIDVLEKNTTLKPEQKEEQLAHYRSQLKGPSKSAGGPAPSGANTQ